MGISSVTELIEGRESTREPKGKRTYQRKYQVITDNKNTGPGAVRIASGLPSMYAPYTTSTEFDGGAIVVKKTVSPTDEWRVWEVTVEYSSQPPDRDQDDENPIDRAPRWSWSFRPVNVVVERDKDDKLLRNSAGEVFDPPFEIEEYRLIASVQRNEVSFPVRMAFDYIGAVNSDSFLGFPKGTVRCTNLGASPQKTDNDVTYFEVSYEFEFNRKKHNPVKLLDIGFNEIDEDPDVALLLGEEAVGHLPLRPIISPLTSEPFSTPQLLNGRGQRLDKEDDPVFHEFDIYDEKPFAAFRLT
jgi:hypothetical protein